MAKKSEGKKKIRPEQHQNKQPGLEWKMDPLPRFFDPSLQVKPKLQDKVAVISGGDSGIGRAVAAGFAAHGADVAILFLNETDDAALTRDFIEKHTDRRCLNIRCDIREEKNCRKAIAKVMKQFGRIDILVNNAAVQYPQERIEDISDEQLENTFRTNVFSMFYLCRACVPLMKKGSSIINTASVTAYRGSTHLLDYAASKGAIVSFTRSLSGNLAKKGIRVNGVAPGPIWTPLIPSSFDHKHVSKFGSDVPMKRAGEPAEVASSYIFLASNDASYITGQFIHPNGGEIVNA